MRFKEFNRNSVLEKCIPLFWKKGFDACPISEIVEVTGVNRFSLYEEFGNKEGILYATLALYHERYNLPRFEILSEDGDLVEIIRNFFLSFLDKNQVKQEGSYMIHIGTEYADRDVQVNSILKSFIKELEQLFVSLLNRYDDMNEKSELYARHLTGLYCTSMSFSLIHSEKERLKHIINGIELITNKKLSYASKIK